MKLKAGEHDQHFHYCPACRLMHVLPRNWVFDGNFESPTFDPSFRHRFGDGKVCHYRLTKGLLNYEPDCTHGMARQQVPLPEIPAEYLAEDSPYA